MNVVQQGNEGLMSSMRLEVVGMLMREMLVWGGGRRYNAKRRHWRRTKLGM